MNVREGDAEGFGDDHGYFGVQSLAHFSAAVGEENGTIVGIDVDEGACLVEEEGGEGDAEFGGDDAQAFLCHLCVALNSSTALRRAT